MKRAVRAVIRLIAAGLLVFGGMGLGLEYMRHLVHKVEVHPWNCVLGAVLLALGVGLLAASGRLAERFSDDFDE
jgi:hypothetical protein